MTVTLTPQLIITTGALVTALVVICTQVVKFVRWVDNQKKQDTDIQKVREQHIRDVEEIKAEMARNMAGINEEQTVLTYGVLACLKGLQEKGCNGPVTEAIATIEKHLNKKAHSGES